jgi:hypothetical protein
MSHNDTYATSEAWVSRGGPGGSNYDFIKQSQVAKLKSPILWPFLTNFGNIFYSGLSDLSGLSDERLGFCKSPNFK